MDAKQALPEVPEAPDDAEAAERVVYRGPQRVLRSVVCSLGCSEEFGRKMEQEARRRRFFEAGRRAFLGDGLAWNWATGKKHFSSFTLPWQAFGLLLIWVGQHRRKPIRHAPRTNMRGSGSSQVPKPPPRGAEAPA